MSSDPAGTTAPKPSFRKSAPGQSVHVPDNASRLGRLYRVSFLFEPLANIEGRILDNAALSMLLNRLGDYDLAVSNGSAAFGVVMSVVARTRKQAADAARALVKEALSATTFSVGDPVVTSVTFAYGSLPSQLAVKDIAELLSISKQAASQRTQAKSFPAPANASQSLWDTELVLQHLGLADEFESSRATPDSIEVVVVDAQDRRR